VGRLSFEKERGSQKTVRKIKNETETRVMKGGKLSNISGTSKDSVIARVQGNHMRH